MFLAAWTWFTGNPVARKIGLICLAILGALAAYKIWKGNVENGVRRQERAAQKEQEAIQRGVLVETVTQLGQETGDAKDRAIAAPDALSPVSSADELRDKYPDNAAIIHGPRQAGGGQGS